jgi:hypothetical protein
VVQEEFREEIDWVVRLGLVGLGEGLGKDETDLVLLQVGNVTVLFVKNWVGARL